MKGLLCPECGRTGTMKEHNIAEIKCSICGALARIRFIHEKIAVPSVIPYKRTTTL